MVGVANMALCGVAGRRGCPVPRNACVACLVPVFMFAHPVQAAGATRDLSTEAFATTALIVLGALTLFSIGFDRLEEFMLRLRAKATKPVVRAMFQELSGLGCLGVVLFVVESTPGFTSISKAVYGDSHETDLASVIHDVHMVRGPNRCGTRHVATITSVYVSLLLVCRACSSSSAYSSAMWCCLW